MILNPLSVRYHRPRIWLPALALNLTHISTVPSKLSLGSPPYTISLQFIIRILRPYSVVWVVYLRIRPGPRLCLVFRNKFIFFTVKGCEPNDQPPSCRTTPCRLSAAAYSIHSQLPSIAGGRSSIRNTRTCHAVVTGKPSFPFFFLSFFLSFFPYFTLYSLCVTCPLLFVSFVCWFVSEETNSVSSVHERTVPTERAPLVGEVSANFCD
jgi:hypothetical protein